MTSLGIKTVLALALAIPLALAGCGAADDGAEARTAAMEHGDHGDHGGHGNHGDHGAPAGHEDREDAAMAGMHGGGGEMDGAVKAFDHRPQVGEKAICPVTGEAFVVSDEALTSEHGGRYYAFCCAACKPRFDADPAAFGG